MSKYISFSEEEKQKARETDLCSFLRSQGETLKRSGSEFEWRDGSQKVSIRGNLWFHQYDQTGGDAIDFVCRYYSKSFPEAVRFLLGDCHEPLPSNSKEPEEKEKAALILPPKNDNMRRVFAYLLFQRNLERSVLDTFVHQKMIYESSDYHNAVFVGFDSDGNPRHANMRGIGKESTFKGNAPNSVPEYSFHWNGADNILFLFEAPIDMLSYISMHKEQWQSHSYAASCSVSDRVLLQMLRDNPAINTVFLCFDNDEPGQNAAKRIEGKLFTMGIKSEILVPVAKDWNEDLQNVSDESEERICPGMQLS